jgi:molybdopterin molybdotransferase
MDGYACRRCDLEHELTVVETIQAGTPPTKEIGDRQCAKIMTGAMLPEGADCVIMIEFTEEVRDGVVRFTASSTRDNICRKSEDIHAGEVVLRKGTRIGPQHIAVLATVGCVRPKVHRKARVGIIATGDELVEPRERPGPSQIRSSNSYQLYAQVLAADAAPMYYGIARDTENEIDAALKRAIAQNDVVLISGGVSKGDYDFVPGVMQRNGIEILFDSIAMKPGKPTTFGVSPEIYCFGLPGNPVSTFIQFEILVKPFLYKLMGHDFHAPHSVLPLAERIVPERTERETWVPVKITPDGRVAPREYHGSAHINALCQADGLIIIPIGSGALEEGTLVRVRLLP